jgi:transposase
MLHAGLDLSRRRLDVCLLDEQGAIVQHITAPPDADGLRGLARQVASFGGPVCAAVESMNGARFVHDQLELAGWQVAIADATKVKGLALIDDLQVQIDACELQLRRLGADHPYIRLLTTAPGIAWVLGYTIAAEIGDIARFPSPKRLCGYTGLCPRVSQSARPRPPRPARQQRPDLAALGADRGRHPRRLPSRLPRPLPAHPRPARQAARRQGRPGGGGPQARRGDLVQLTRGKPFAPAPARPPADTLVAVATLD